MCSRSSLDRGSQVEKPGAGQVCGLSSLLSHRLLCVPQTRCRVQVTALPTLGLL